MKMKKILTLGVLSCICANVNIANAAEFSVPVPYATISAAILAANDVAGSNTLTIGADQTILAAITTATHNLAISGDSATTLRTVDFNNGAFRFAFTGVGNNSSVSNLIITNATNNAINAAVGTSITVENVDFEANKATGNGGAISNSNGTVTVDYTNFTSNEATNGGAIYNAGATADLEITGGTFKSNTASTSGGAIYNTTAGANLDITGTTFDSNTANTNGGAIYNNTGTTATINTATFTSNEATNGGAILNTGATANLEITGTKFELNTARSAGGAIYNGVGTTATIENSNFTSNKANTSAGGAIYNSGSTTITNTDFKSNEAMANSGGAIYNAGATASLEINGGTFMSNTTGVNGGAINNNIAGATLDITGTAFELNTANTYGGAIYSNTGTTTTIDNATFTSNETKVSAGGAIYNSGTATIENSVFTSNIAKTSGGAIVNTLASADLTITGGTFKSNTASTYGGAVYNTTAGANLKITGGIYESNTALGGGAVFSNVGTTTTINNATFISNKAGNNAAGSAGAVANNGNMTINGSTFTSNMSTNYGGAVVSSGNSAVIKINNSIFNSNSAAYYGGAVVNGYPTTAGEMIITGCTFESNTAATNGGAVFNNQTGSITITDSTFVDNTAGDNGGAINNTGTLNLTSTTGDVIFTGNNAGGIGDDLYNTETGIINIDGTLNKVSLDGGIAGFGVINKSNDGELLLAGNSLGFAGTYNHSGGVTTNSGGYFNGVTNLSAGTVELAQGSVVGAGSAFNIESGAALDISTDGDLVFGDGAAISGLNGSYGAVNKTGAGALVLSGSNDFQGDFTQTSGVTTVIGDSFFGVNNTISDSTLNLFLNNNSQTINQFNISNANIYAMNNVVNTFNISNMTASGNNDFSVDVNGRTFESDRFVIGNLSGNGTFNVSGLNVIGAPTAQVIPYQIFEATDLSAFEFTETIGDVRTPVFNYQFVSNGDGNFSLVRIAGQDGINKQAYRGQVVPLATYYNQLLVNNILFDHVYLDSNELIARGNQNKYAAIDPLFAPYQFKSSEGSLWFRTYTAIEKLSFTQGLGVNNTAYGQIVGADFPVIDLSNGWKFLPTTYIGYNGGRQSFNDVTMYQNGGQAGFMGTFMKGDYIGSVLAYGGGYHNEMSLAGVTDTTGNWFAGTAVKSAYNFHPTRNSIIQPTLLASYNIFGRQSWGSDFGAVSMNSGYLNGINVAPGLNFIYGRETWSVYLTTQYMYNINDQLSGSVAGVPLPSISMRHGYIEYGVGATKTWKERFMGFMQVTLRNGGRTGVSFMLGLNYKF